MLSLFDTICVSTRIPHFLKPAGYVYLRTFDIFVFQEPSYVGKIALVSIWLRMA